MTAQDAPMRVLPGDARYLADARAEAAFWDRPGIGFLERDETDADGPVQRQTNRRFTGREDRHWFETIADFGPFRRGLLLGTGGVRQEARILETNPQLHLTVMDISMESLANRERELGARFTGRVGVRAADFNFLELEPESYDCVISSSALHHITNLEHVAAQVNRALMPDGYVFIQDYVGESKHEIADEKKRLFELVYQRDTMRRLGRRLALEWFKPETSPFCGIRAEETLPVFGRYLRLQELRTAGALAYLTLRARPYASDMPRVTFRTRAFNAARRRIRRALRRPPAPLVSPEFMDELLLMDELACDSGLLQPANAFAIYRRRE